ESFGTECFILDDGFQHLRLARNLDIVTIDATNPWGGGHLLPYGRLREPISGLRRADCIVLTRCDQTQTDNLDALKDQIRAFIRGRPLFESMMSAPSKSNSPGPVAAFCAVGNPESFFSQLKKAGYEVVVTKSFTDHHRYTQRDIDELASKATRAGAKALITTAKDAVKLRSLSIPLPYQVFEIEIAIKDEELFLNLLRETLA
ncbi:MAG TPA: tetraacyldisaccharide 4'-kinase, partial [Pyrinomonadaceae bacterium]|nr:tetraacyldisaccharide 4'-kinase [Pyrinomonadaceae bacterium]